MSLSIPSYKELSIKCDTETSTIWVGMNPVGRQCFTLSMLVELHDLMHRLDKYGSPDPAYPDAIQYLVLESDHPEVYNLGGDLEYFSELVQQKKFAQLRDYGIVCIDLIYWTLTGGKRQITTIANIAGDAFGGGFEAALACNYVIAEKQSVFSFPEALFGFFPGMGSYDLFRRFSGPLEADRAFMTGKRYSAQELKLMGGIYTLVEAGKGTKAVEKFILEREGNQTPHYALHRIKQYEQSISYESLEYSIDLWVKAAMNLTKKNLRMMSILTRRQKKKGTVNRVQREEQQHDYSHFEPLKMVASK
jgi:DSF synthase